MSNIVSKKLSIDKNNIKQYCEADNVSFDVTDHAWRKWLNGSSDGYVILKDEGKAVIYPTDTAHPFKADSLISASRSSGSCKVELLVGGTSVHSESYTSSSQTQKSKSDITDSAITNSTKATEIKWHVNGANANNQRGDLIELTLYFYQYAMSANVGDNAIKSVSVSNSAPYHGDSVTFSAELIKGATWDGWYSDAACTTLISAERNYTITADSDVTLYAKATAPAAIYSCAAIAKENINSVSVSDGSVVSGESCTFSAVPAEHYSFSAWYSDADCTNLVSHENPYTTAITGNTMLYATASLTVHSISVGTVEDGIATVSSTSVPYGGTATFSCTVTGANREFYGWYSDAEHKLLVSEDATYSCTVTKDLVLYPKIGHKRYTAVIHPVKLFDPLPYRGLVYGANPSQSIPVDVAKIQNITLAEASTTVYAYQPHVTSAPHTYGMSMWFGNNPLPDMPDNATVVDVHAEFGYSLADAGYDSIKIGMGRFEYVSDNDETPITDNASFAYVDESDNTDDEPSSEDVSIQTLLNRTSNYQDPMTRATDAKELAIRSGTSIIQDSMDVPINDTTLYPVSVSDLKNGKLGFQINCVSQSNSGSPRRFRLHAFDLYVTYTIEDVSYKCDVVSDGHVDVTIQSHDNAPGVECTWIAKPEGGYRFAGWYSDAEYTNLVSTELEYTATINSPITLYAKSKYHSRVVTRVLDIPFGKGVIYLTGKDSNGKTLGTESGSGWKPNFELSDYGWLANIADVQDIKATAAMCNKSSKPYIVKAVLNNAAKNILFPNATAHLVRLDSHGCFGRAAIGARVVSNKITNPNTGADYITPTFGGISGSVWRPNMIHDVELNYENIRYDWVLNSTRDTEICYLMAQGTSSSYRAIGIDQIKLTGYFEEYDFAANIANGSKGVRSVSVSKDIGYEGDEVTYTATIASYATFDGWFSDEDCTNLVSTEKEYTTVPDANLTLYAKTTVPEGNVYTCAAVAKDEIESVSVSDSDMVEGGSCTFTATINPGSKFLGWYSDEACTQLISEDVSYTTIVLANMTLYAKGERILYTIGVGVTEHCTTSTSVTTAWYGDVATFSCIPDEGYEFKGWYSDEGLTQLVSEDASYEYTVTGSVTLWAKVEMITYKVTIVSEYSANYGALEIELNIIAVDFEALTRKEKEYLKTGDYGLISQDKIYDQATDSGNQRERTISVSVNVPKGKYAAMYMPIGKATSLSRDSAVVFYITSDTNGGGSKLTNWPYYWIKPTQDVTYGENKSSYRCECVAIGKEGISYVDATTPVSSPSAPDTMADGKVYTAIFSAETSLGYEFLGWYSDEACTTLVSSENPAYITTPAVESITEAASYTLYAKAAKTETQPTGLSLKLNGSWVEAKTVYRKVDGVWAQQDDPKTLFSGLSSGTESNYLYLGE